MDSTNTTQQPPSLALIDDDQALNALLSEYLQQEGYDVRSFYDGQQALQHIKAGDFDAIVLDIMMPTINGLDVLQQLRQSMQTPVIMLTGRGDDIDKIIGLEMGADDYLAKPCNPRELLARIRALIRRSQAADVSPVAGDAILSHAGVTLNRAQRSVHVDGQALTLTSVEFSMLALLMQHAGHAVSKEQLSDEVLQRPLSAYDRSIDVHVSRIRKKIQALQGGQQAVIKTLRGQGYLFIHGH